MDLDQAIYMVAVAKALNDPGFDRTGLVLTDRCPECSESLDDDPMFNWSHGVIPRPLMTGQLVVIGCEGGRLIDPNRVGIPAPNWQDPYPIEEKGPGN